jgi:8-oxo-dGTP diphosphatase
VTTTTVAAAVVERDGRVLLTRRLAGTHLAGTWEFPGGKCEPGETLDACLRRELLEELGVESSVGGEICSVTHAYPDRRVTLHFFRCTIAEEPVARLGQQMEWVPAARLRDYELPPADAELIARLSPRRDGEAEHTGGSADAVRH